MSKPEKVSFSREKKATPSERKLIREDIIDRSMKVFKAERVFDTRWRRHFLSYALLAAMKDKIDNDLELSPRQLDHLRKTTAWQATFMDRNMPPNLIGRAELWHSVDEAVEPELEAIQKFPEDLKGAPAAYKDALYDQQLIENEWLGQGINEGTED